MNWLVILVAVVAVGALLVAGALWLRSQWLVMQRDNESRLQGFLDDSVTKVTQAQQTALTALDSRAALEKERGVSELDKRKQAIDTSVDRLNKQLERYEQLVTEFEKDRDRKYGALGEQLTSAMDETSRLRQTTDKLSSVLSNNQVRGQWGEKTAVDILRICGLQPGIHYSVQQTMGAGKPDITLFLPAGKHLYMDVKFPINNWARFTRAEQDEERQAAKKAFISDVNGHLQEMGKRGYADSDEALDYILLFISNEQVYGLVNEWMPEIVDKCLQKRIILSGPWTLYAVVRIIRQAWENYRFSEALRDIVKEIKEFRNDYRLFNDRFKEVGERLEKAQKAYEAVAETSHKRLEQRIQKIENYELKEVPVANGSLADKPREELPLLKEMG